MVHYLPIAEILKGATIQVSVDLGTTAMKRFLLSVLYRNTSLKK